MAKQEVRKHSWSEIYCMPLGTRFRVKAAGQPVHYAEVIINRKYSNGDLEVLHCQHNTKFAFTQKDFDTGGEEWYALEEHEHPCPDCGISVKSLEHRCPSCFSAAVKNDTLKNDKCRHCGKSIDDNRFLAVFHRTERGFFCGPTCLGAFIRISAQNPAPAVQEKSIYCTCNGPTKICDTGMFSVWKVCGKCRKEKK